MDRMDHVFDRLDGLQEYGEKVARYPGFRADVWFSGPTQVKVVLWDRTSCLGSFHRTRAELIDAAFDDAWAWLYAQPPFEMRELKRIVQKLSGVMEEFSESESEVARALYQKLFEVREEASRHLLEYRPKEEAGL